MYCIELSQPTYHRHYLNLCHGNNEQDEEKGRMSNYK